MIGDAIHAFSRHPRYSLAMVALYMTFFSILVTVVIAEKLSNVMGETIDLIKKMWVIVSYTYIIADSSRKYIEGTEANHNEAHATTATALRAVHNATQALAESIQSLRPQVDTPPTPSIAEVPSPEVANIEDDEELKND